YPSIWKSVQWDGGVWMLPSAAQLYSLFYNPDAFDEANLAYPTEDWQLENFAHAIERITLGGVEAAESPGFIGFNYIDRELAYTLIGSGLYDESIVPNPPQLNQPEAVAFVERWASLFERGAVYNPDFDYG